MTLLLQESMHPLQLTYRGVTTTLTVSDAAAATRHTPLTSPSSPPHPHPPPPPGVFSFEDEFDSELPTERGKKSPDLPALIKIASDLAGKRSSSFSEALEAIAAAIEGEGCDQLVYFGSNFLDLCALLPLALSQAPTACSSLLLSLQDVTPLLPPHLLLLLTETLLQPAPAILPPAFYPAAAASLLRLLSSFPHLVHPPLTASLFHHHVNLLLLLHAAPSHPPPLLLLLSCPAPLPPSPVINFMSSAISSFPQDFSPFNREQLPPPPPHIQLSAACVYVPPLPPATCLNPSQA